MKQILKPSLEKIRQRQTDLERMLRELESRNKSYPEGYLKISHRETKTQYYLKNGGKDTKWKYIRKDQKDLAFQIAQRDYDQRTIQSVKKELRFIHKLFNRMSWNEVEDVYENLSDERKKLVTPLVIPQELFVKEWKSASWEKMRFPEDYPEYYTVKQERVRSKSEVLIADALERMQIPYRYEYPLLLDGKTFRPDFTILHVASRSELIWEHLGMMDSLEYVEKALSKMAVYEKSGYVIGQNLILTWESSRIPLSTLRIQRTIQQYLS